MSQVKRLKEMGVQFKDPKMWDLLHDLDNLPGYLEEKKRRKLEREKFVESVFGEAWEHVKKTQESYNKHN